MALRSTTVRSTDSPVVPEQKTTLTLVERRYAACRSMPAMSRVPLAWKGEKVGATRPVREGRSGGRPRERGQQGRHHQPVGAPPGESRPRQRCILSMPTRKLKFDKFGAAMGTRMTAPYETRRNGHRQLRISVSSPMADDDAAPMAEEPEPIWMGLQEREQEAASADGFFNASRRASLTKEDLHAALATEAPVPKLEKADSALYFDAAALIMKTAQSSDSVRLQTRRRSRRRRSASLRRASRRFHRSCRCNSSWFLRPPGRLDAKTAAVAAVNIQANARGMMARRDYHQTQKAVRSIEAHARGAHARHGLHEAQTAAKSIEVHARGFRCRREYNKQVKCARSDRRGYAATSWRRRALGFARGEEDPLHVNAVVPVRKMLEMPEDAARAPKIASNYLTTDFIDVIDLGPARGTGPTASRPTYRMPRAARRSRLWTSSSIRG